MKKYIFAGIVASVMMFGANCYAAQSTILVEGENYDYATFDVPLYTHGEFNGGKFMNLLVTPTAEEYKVVYTFESPIEGSFILDIRCNQLNQTYSTDFYYAVNDGELTSAVGGVTQKIADFKNSIYGNDLVKEYRLGEFDLNEGKNTLTIVVDKNDTRKLLDNKLCFILDYFKLTSVEGEFKLVQPSENCGVFERKQTVKYVIIRTVKEYVDYEYTYEVTDFWGRRTDSGEFTISAGKRKKTLDLGAYGLGWYDLKIFKKGHTEPVGYAHFSVVPKISERYKGDTPFAVDSGSAVLIKDDELANRFQKTLPLAGIKWVRERADAINFALNGYEDYDEYFMNRFDKIKEWDVKTAQILVTEHLQWKDTAFTDLFRAYEFQKDFIENTQGKIDLLEIDNEVDGASRGIPADRYSAYMKAAYLAKVDSGTDMEYSMTSLCLDPDRVFTDGLFRNELMNWTDIYNFHAHTNPSSKNKITGIRQGFLDEYYEKKMTEYDVDIPNWLTEAGIYMPLKNGAENIDSEQKREQARYLTTATVEGLAKGVDKFFWFIWVKYNENGSDLSTFDTNYNPYPSYQAEAICSYVLGKGKYIGEDCNEKANTYMFDNGTNDVMVLWTDSPKKYEIKTDKRVVVTDLMGQEEVMYPENGKVMVNIAYYPTYVTFDGKADLANYYPREYKVEEVEEKSFNEAERIIIQQTFNQDLSTASNKGYLIENKATETVVLTVNNFNNEEKEVKLTGEFENAEVVFEQEIVRVPAMSKVDVIVKVTPNMDGKFDGVQDYKGYLTFRALVNGMESSPSVSTIRVGNDVTVEPKYLFEGAEDINNFDITNVMEGAVVSSNIVDDGSYQFHVQMNAAAGWYYPRIKVTDTKRLEDSNGLVFMIKADEATVGMGDFKCFVNMKDGRRYYTGSESKFACVGDWVQNKVSWDDLMLFESPLGAFDIRAFDATLVDSIEIGCNLYPGEAQKAKQMSFFLKTPGYFVYENKKDVNKDIVINGIIGDKKYEKGEIGMVSVDLAEGINNLRVMLTDEKLENYTVDGNKLLVDLTELTKGKYTLRVVGRNISGVNVSDKVDFYIN